MLKKIFFSLVLILISVDFISAFGVSPGIVRIDFKPNLNTSFEMTVYNSLARDEDAEISIDLFELNQTIVDEFRDIVTLEKTRIPFNKDEAQKTVKVSLNFPEGFSQGGIHEIRVGAKPYVVKTVGAGMGMVSENAIRILINVSDKYVSPKYAKVKKLKILNIDAKSVKQGEKADINILVKSESDVALKDVNGKIKIMQGGIEISTIQTDKVDINPGEEKTLKAFLSTNSIQPSSLVLDVEIFYGSESVKGQGTMSVTGESGAEGGIQIMRGKFQWWWILIIVLVLVVIILLFLLLRKKKNENPNQMQNQGAYQPPRQQYSRQQPSQPSQDWLR